MLFTLLELTVLLRVLAVRFLFRYPADLRITRTMYQLLHMVVKPSKSIHNRETGITTVLKWQRVLPF
jgi:hypothetical protein